MWVLQKMNGLVELKIEKSASNILVTLIPIVWSKKSYFINKKIIKKYKSKSFIELSESVDEYTLGNVIKINCMEYFGGSELSGLFLLGIPNLLQ